MGSAADVNGQIYDTNGNLIGPDNVFSIGPDGTVVDNAGIALTDTNGNQLPTAPAQIALDLANYQAGVASGAINSGAASAPVASAGSSSTPLLLGALALGYAFLKGWL